MIFFVRNNDKINMICQLINDFGDTKNHKNDENLGFFNKDVIKNLKQEIKILRENVQKQITENNEKNKLLKKEKQQNKIHKSNVCIVCP